MKNIILILIVLSSSIKAEVSGSLDKTYGTKGLGNVPNYLGQSTFTLASIIDSQSRLYVLEGFYHPGTNLVRIFIQRYLVNGQADAGFQTTTSAIDPSLVDGDFTILLDSNGGVFLGYSTNVCDGPNLSCQQDIFIKHFNSSADFIGEQVIAFDLGGTPLRNNDKFADMVLLGTEDSIGDIEQLAIAATVDHINVHDSDFGIAMLNVDNLDGSLSFSSFFSGDGKQTCAFDQDIGHSGVGKDEAKTIVLEPNFTQWAEIIIGGSAFEGNGTNNNGWNLAFCKLTLSGNQVQKWSTQPNPDTLDDDIEILQDMYFAGNSAGRLVVATKASTGNSNDFSIVQYLLSGNTWLFDDTGFGINGWVSIGFNELFIGDTNDIVNSIIVENDEDITVAGHMSWQDNGLNYSRIALARFDKFGQLRTNWGYNGSITHDFSGILKNEITNMTYDSNKKELYLVGQYQAGSVKDAYIANLLDNPDLIFLNGLE